MRSIPMTPAQRNKPPQDSTLSVPERRTYYIRSHPKAKAFGVSRAYFLILSRSANYYYSPCFSSHCLAYEQVAFTWPPLFLISSTAA